MSEAERRTRYDSRRVLIETERVLAPRFRSTLLPLTGAQIELLLNVVAYLNRASTFVTEYHGAHYLTPTASEWDSLQSIVADLEALLMVVIILEDYVCVRDKKPQNTHGGTFTAGAWRTRDITEEQADTAGICAVESNQVTLAAGTYRCLIACPAYRVNQHQARLYNITADTPILAGMSMLAHTAQDGYNISWVRGPFTLTVTTVLEIQHYGTVTKADDGFGTSMNITDEVYAVAEFWRSAIP